MLNELGKKAKVFVHAHDGGSLDMVEAWSLRGDGARWQDLMCGVVAWRQGPQHLGKRAVT
jgi:hypothetical protein